VAKLETVMAAPENALDIITTGDLELLERDGRSACRKFKLRFLHHR